MNMNQKEKLREILILLAYSDEELVRAKGISRQEIKTNLRVVYELDRTSFDKLAGRLSISKEYLKGKGPYIFDDDEYKVITDELKKQNQRLRDILNKYNIDESYFDEYVCLSRRSLKLFLNGKLDYAKYKVELIARVLHISIKYIEGKSNQVFDSKKINEKMESLIVVQNKKK